MGARHVAAVFAFWGGELNDGKPLSPPAFRLLVHMAHTAKDSDHPPTFFGGREHLAFGLGRKVPRGDNDEDRRTRDATFRAVNRAIAQLMAAGALHDRDHPLARRPAANHRPARYVLNVHDGGRTASCEQVAYAHGDAGHPTSSERRTPRDGDAGHPASERRTPGVATQDAPRPPEEKEEPRGLTSGVAGDPAAQGLGRVRIADRACGHNKITADGDCLVCDRERTERELRQRLRHAREERRA
jgi:hypothetical protein